MIELLLTLFSIPTIFIVIFLAYLAFSKSGSVFSFFVKKYFIIVVLAFALLNGLIYLFYFSYFSPIDEDSHFSYIQFIAENKKIPLLNDYISPVTISLKEGIYPKETTTDPQKIGMAGKQYEAFQPPLYYISAIPFYFLGGDNFIHKIYLIRFWGLLQLLILVFISYLIFNNLKSIISEKFYFYTLAGLIIIFLTPAMIVRSITIGNDILPIIFISLIFLWMTKIYNKKLPITYKDAIILGFFTGLALLSRVIVLFIIPIIILMFLFHKKDIIKNSILFIVTFLLLLSPWLIFNQKNYGSLTPNSQARNQQEKIIYSAYKTEIFGLNYVKKEFPLFMKKIWMPEEVDWNHMPKNSHFMEIAQFLNLLWIVGMFGLFTSSFYFLKQKKYYPFVFIIIAIGSIFTIILQQTLASIVSNWPVMQGRYLHPVIIPIAFMFVYGLYQLRFNIVTRLLAFALILIPILLNLEYIYMLINS